MQKVVWKTKEIADEMEVNPSTVQRWVKYFQLPYTITPLGHFEMGRDTYNKLKHVHLETTSGKRLREITFTDLNNQEPVKLKDKMVSAKQLDDRFEKLVFQLNHLDKKLQTKADEVAEYQILQQRKEINELNDLVFQLSDRIANMEEKLDTKEEKAFSLDSNHKPLKKRRLAGIFSL